MITRRIVLHFPQNLAGKAVVYKLAKEYDLAFNILKADVTPESAGSLILEVRGKRENYEMGIQYIKESGVDVIPLSKNILRDDKTCSHCGICVPLCPSNSFFVALGTRKVEFNYKSCIVCGLCVKICPFNAMKIIL